MEDPMRNEKSVVNVKADDQKTVATALFSPPPGNETAAVLRGAIEKATAAFAEHLETVVFPAELKRYADTPDSGKRRSYAPLHIYLCWELTSDSPLSSCLGELFVYRGEQLADYNAFSLTADERAGIFLTAGALLSGKKAKRAAAKEPIEGFYLQNGNVVGYRRISEGLPCRCRRRDVREKFLQQWTIGSSDAYVFVPIDPKALSAAQKASKVKKSPAEPKKKRRKKKVSGKEKKSEKTT